jgi:uncharacterized metal-binding protein YceD (DUF177 family)
MTEPAPARPTRFRTGGLSQRKPTRFHWTPDAAQRAELARELELLSLHRLEFTGQIDPVGRDEIRLHGTLTAAVDQACIVTLAPVTSQINEAVTRRFVADLPTPQGEEVEMPEDDGLEPMPEVLDLVEIAAETLMLALPLYPRAPGAEFGEKLVAPAGAEPVPEVKDKPFAGLASLADRLKSGPKSGNNSGE